MSNVFPIQSSSVRTPPSLLAFAETWFEDASVAWRSTTTGGVQSILARHLLPVLRGVPLESFTRAEVLASDPDSHASLKPMVRCDQTRE